MQMQRLVSTSTFFRRARTVRKSSLWSGDRSGRVPTSRDASMIPFSLMWAASRSFGSTGRELRRALFFEVVGVPFVLIGLYMMSSHSFMRRCLRSRTYYGLTNERVIIISGLFAPTVKSLQVQHSPASRFSEEASGTGTVTSGLTCPIRQRDGCG